MIHSGELPRGLELVESVLDTAERRDQVSLLATAFLVKANALHHSAAAVRLLVCTGW